MLAVFYKHSDYRETHILKTELQEILNPTQLGLFLVAVLVWQI